MLAISLLHIVVFLTLRWHAEASELCASVQGDNSLKSLNIYHRLHRMHSHTGKRPIAKQVHRLATRRLARRRLNKKIILLEGAGQATFYYEKQGPGEHQVKPVSGTRWRITAIIAPYASVVRKATADRSMVKEYAEMKGTSMCEPWQNPKTLEQRKTNQIVALPLKILKGHTEEYCGKEIIAHFHGKTVGGLIAWDGCVACDGNGGLDFSSTVFGKIVGEENCQAGRLDGLTWELTTDQIWDLNGNPLAADTSATKDQKAVKGLAAAVKRPESTKTSSRTVKPSKSQVEAVPTIASKKVKHKQQKQEKLKKEKKQKKKTKKKPKKPPVRESPTKSVAKQKQMTQASHVKKPPKVEIPEDFEADWENMG